MVENFQKDRGCFPIEFFSYIEVELAGTAAETAKPRRTLPRAVNAVPLRVMIVYVEALLAILTILPW
nr:hypothetical protein [Mycobacterium lepromatosis]